MGTAWHATMDHIDNIFYGSNYFVMEGDNTMELVCGKNIQFCFEKDGENILDIKEFFLKQGDIGLLFGPSGCGKTTFLQQLVDNLGRNGIVKGEIINRSLQTGYVWQNVENQIVTDRFEHEIVFGMENQGAKKQEMEKHLAELVTFFGMERFLERDTMDLSGGEKQIMNIMSALAMDPDFLILDEPTSQLDPVSSRKLYEFLKELNEEFGITLLIAEQRLDEACTIADTFYMMENGTISVWGSREKIWQSLKTSPYLSYFPSYIQMYQRETQEPFVPRFDKKTARQWFTDHYEKKDVVPATEKSEDGRKRWLARGIWFSYEKKGKDVLADISFEVSEGKITTILGGNGSGKSTLLSVLTGTEKPYHGKINQTLTFSYLPQRVMDLFLNEQIQDYLMDSAVQQLAVRLGLVKEGTFYIDDLSGGEVQRLGLSYVLAKDCDIYYLDEPTKGLDPVCKKVLGEILADLKKAGKTVVIVSHDMEFTAAHSDEVGLMFKGRIATWEPKHEFFKSNHFYTTTMNRIARGVSKDIVLAEDVDIYAKTRDC